MGQLALKLNPFLHFDVVCGSSVHLETNCIPELRFTVYYSCNLFIVAGITQSV